MGRLELGRTLRVRGDLAILGLVMHVVVCCLAT